MRTAMLAMLVLAGCAQTPPAPAPASQPVVQPPVVVQECLDVAKYARAIAQLREIGVSRDDISTFTTTPVVATFPLQFIQYDVFARRDEGVDTFGPRYYKMCVEHGYENLLATMRTMERDRAAAADRERDRQVRTATRTEAIIRADVADRKKKKR